MKLKKITSLLIVAILAIAMNGLFLSTVAFAWDSEVSSQIQPTEIKNGQIVSLQNQKVKELSNIPVYDLAWIESFYQNGTEGYLSVPVKLSWSEIPNATYDLRVSLQKDFSSIVEECQGLVEPEVTLKSPLLSGRTYYWQVKATLGQEKIVSEIFSFTTEGTIRTLNIDGVLNTRDIGGYVGANGVVSQGKVIRGGELEHITAEGKATLSSLGIKTDLDLRSESETGSITESPAGIDNYIAISSPYYAGDGNANGIHLSSKQGAVKEIISVFADSNNYPIYLHCSFGKDRTGTIAYLLNGLLGVDKEQLRIDYWLSVLSSVVTEKGSKDAYSNIEHMYQMLNALESYISGISGRTYADKIQNYLVNTVGMTESQMTAIKSNMLSSTSLSDGLVNVVINSDSKKEARVLSVGDSVKISEYLSNYEQIEGYTRKVTDKNGNTVTDFTIQEGASDLEIYISYQIAEQFGTANTNKIETNQDFNSQTVVLKENKKLGWIFYVVGGAVILALSGACIIVKFTKKKKGEIEKDEGNC